MIAYNTIRGCFRGYCFHNLHMGAMQQSTCAQIAFNQMQCLQIAFNQMQPFIGKNPLSSLFSQGASCALLYGVGEVARREEKGGVQRVSLFFHKHIRTVSWIAMAVSSIALVVFSKDVAMGSASLVSLGINILGEYGFFPRRVLKVFQTAIFYISSPLIIREGSIFMRLTLAARLSCWGAKKLGVPKEFLREFNDQQDTPDTGDPKLSIKDLKALGKENTCVIDKRHLTLKLQPQGGVHTLKRDLYLYLMGKRNEIITKVYDDDGRVFHNNALRDFAIRSFFYEFGLFNLRASSISMQAPSQAYNRWVYPWLLEDSLKRYNKRNIFKMAEKYFLDNRPLYHQWWKDWANRQPEGLEKDDFMGTIKGNDSFPSLEDKYICTMLCEMGIFKREE